MSQAVPYALEGAIDGVELRRYPPMVLATVRGASDNGAFRILFQYISGNNRSTRKIPMTAPVISSGQKIEMTAPVLSSPGSFSFVLPAELGDEVPVPLDSRASLERVPERRMAALRFRGVADARSVAKNARRLLDLLAQQGIATEGDVLLMRYNAPFTPGFLRRNEVAIVLRPVDSPEAQPR